MKARTTPKKARRQQPASVPPAGLVAAFAMVTKENATPIAVLSTAKSSYQPAREIIDLLHGRADGDKNQDVLIADVLERANVAIHGEVYDDPETMPQLASDTGFDVGFAVCWLLLMAVNGNGGAR